MKRVADEAEPAGVAIVPHSWSSVLNTAAALHVLSASNNAFVFEIKPNPSPMQYELVTNPIEQVGGLVQVRTSPGLGVTVDEAVVRKYALA